MRQPRQIKALPLGPPSANVHAATPEWWDCMRRKCELFHPSASIGNSALGTELYSQLTPTHVAKLWTVLDTPPEQPQLSRGRTSGVIFRHQSACFAARQKQTFTNAKGMGRPLTSSEHSVAAPGCM